MKITDISHAQINSHRFLLVKVVTDEGIIGYGETSGLTGASAWIDRFRPLLVGDSPFDVQRIVTQLLWGAQVGEFLTYGADRHAPVDDWLVRYGAAGASLDHAATRAVSGIEMALLDVVGKALGTPVYNLLGGKFRDKIPVYLDLAGIAGVDRSAWRDYGSSARELGFRAVKCDVDMLGADSQRDPWNRSLSSKEINRITSALGAFREGLGDDVEMAVDCHGQYNAVDAERLARELEPLHLMWLEDPLPDFNPEALARVRQATATPIAAGELFQTLFEHRPYIDSHAIDIVHPDSRMVGGLLEHKRVADYADAHYIPTAAHNGSSPIGTFAMAHVCAAIRSFLYLEYHWWGVDWIDDLADRPLLVDGCVEVADLPGFGTHVDEDRWAAAAAR